MIITFIKLLPSSVPGPEQALNKRYFPSLPRSGYVRRSIVNNGDNMITHFFPMFLNRPFLGRISDGRLPKFSG